MKLLSRGKKRRDEVTGGNTLRDNHIDREEIFVSGLSAVIVLVLLLLIYKGGFLITGEKKTFLMGDSLLQYVPVIKMFLRHLFRGDSLTYSFEVGMGMPTWAVYAYYALSPFNLLFLVIADIDKAAFCVMAGKLMLAAALFSLLIVTVRIRNSCVVITRGWISPGFICLSYST